jgi:hypothetical protein
VPGELVDTAFLRFNSGYLTPQELFDALQRRRIRVVVAVRAFALLPEVAAGLRARYPVRIRHGSAVLYLTRGAASG